MMASNSAPGDGDGVAVLATGSQRQAHLLKRSISASALNSSSYPLRRSRSRQFSRSSTDTVPLTTIAENPVEENHASHHWHSFTLLFVALPAAASLLFDNGGVIMTDILFFSLGCLFLYWSVKWPWHWYHSAQTRVYIPSDDDMDADFAMVEESGDEDDIHESKGQRGVSGASPHTSQRGEGQDSEAQRKLRFHELLALVSCFLTPVGVAYLLHSIRPLLSRPTGGVVSNSNLTLFALAAEIRPLMHLFKLIEARTLHLQRVVAATPPPGIPNADDQLHEALGRIAELETKVASIQAMKEKGKSLDENVDTHALIANVRQAFQPQVDALNRAVRRYEKRAAMQSVVIEARLRDLESRLRDTASIATAASRKPPPSGTIATVTESVGGMVRYFVQTLSNLVSWPFMVLRDFYRFLFGSRKRKRPRAKGTERSVKGKQRTDIR